MIREDTLLDAMNCKLTTVLDSETISSLGVQSAPNNGPKVRNISCFHNNIREICNFQSSNYTILIKRYKNKSIVFSEWLIHWFKFFFIIYIKLCLTTR